MLWAGDFPAPLRVAPPSAAAEGTGGVSGSKALEAPGIASPARRPCESDARSVSPRSHRANRVPCAHHSEGREFSLRSASPRFASCSFGCDCAEQVVLPAPSLQCREQARSRFLSVAVKEAGEACLPHGSTISFAVARDRE